MKKIILITIVLILGFFAYRFYQVEPSPVINDLVDNALSEDASKVEKEIIKRRAQIAIDQLEEDREPDRIQATEQTFTISVVNSILYFSNNSSYKGICTDQSVQAITHDPSLYPDGTEINCNVSASGDAFAFQVIYKDNGWCVDSSEQKVTLNTSIGTKTSCK